MAAIVKQLQDNADNARDISYTNALNTVQREHSSYLAEFYALEDIWHELGILDVATNLATSLGGLDQISNPLNDPRINTILTNTQSSLGSSNPLTKLIQTPIGQALMGTPLVSAIYSIGSVLLNNTWSAKSDKIGGDLAEITTFMDRATTINDNFKFISNNINNVNLRIKNAEKVIEQSLQDHLKLVDPLITINWTAFENNPTGRVADYTAKIDLFFNTIQATIDPTKVSTHVYPAALKNFKSQHNKILLNVSLYRAITSEMESTLSVFVQTIDTTLAKPSFASLGPADMMRTQLNSVKGQISNGLENYKKYKDSPMLENYIGQISTD